MKKEHLSILTQAEQAAFYEAPDFNEEQRFEFLTLTSNELELVMSRKSWSARVYCCLQIAYFKSVNLFFKVDWNEVGDETIAFILEQYFFDQSIKLSTITDYEHYTQCTAIASLYNFEMWQSESSTKLLDKAHELAKININQQFMALELLSYLKQQKIIRPQYTTLQRIVITAINSEKARINTLLIKQITSDERKWVFSKK